MVSGCVTNDRSESGDSPPRGEQSTAAYTGPETQVSIEPGGTSVSVELEVPTGGWRFELDDHERADGLVRLYATLESPPPGMMVTQAIEQKRIGWETTEPVEQAKVFIRMARRGESAAGAPYREAGEAE
jgi:hypothetical protein